MNGVFTQYLKEFLLNIEWSFYSILNGVFTQFSLPTEYIKFDRVFSFLIALNNFSIQNKFVKINENNFLAYYSQLSLKSQSLEMNWTKWKMLVKPEPHAEYNFFKKELPSNKPQCQSLKFTISLGS